MSSNQQRAEQQQIQDKQKQDRLILKQKIQSKFYKSKTMINVRSLMKEIYDEKEHPHKIVKYLQSNNLAPKTLKKPMYETAEQKISYSNMQYELDLKQKLFGNMLKKNLSSYVNSISQEDDQENLKEFSWIIDILKQEIIESPIGDRDISSYENLNRQKAVYNDLIEFSNALIKYKKYQQKNEEKEMVKQIRHNQIKSNQLQQQSMNEIPSAKKKLRKANSIVQRFMLGIRKQQKSLKEQTEISQLKQLIKDKNEIREKDKAELQKRKELILIMQQLTKKLIKKEHLDEIDVDDENSDENINQSKESKQKKKNSLDYIEVEQEKKINEQDLEEGLANLNQLDLINEQFKQKKLDSKRKLELLSDSQNNSPRNANFILEQTINEQKQNQQPMQKILVKSKFQIATFLKGKKEIKSNQISNKIEEKEPENLIMANQQKNEASKQSKVDIENDINNPLMTVKINSKSNRVIKENQEIVNKQKEQEEQQQQKQFLYYDQKEDIFEKLQKKKLELREEEEKQKKAEKIKRINKIRNKLGLVKSGEIKSFLKNQQLLNSLDEKQRLAQKKPQKKIILINTANYNNNTLNNPNTTSNAVQSPNQNNQINQNNQNTQNINLNTSRNIIGINNGDNSQTIQSAQNKFRLKISRPKLSPRSISKLHFYHDSENFKTINFLSPQNKTMSNLNNFTNYNTGQQTPLLTSRSVQRNNQLNIQNDVLANNEQQQQQEQLQQMKNFNFFSKLRKSAYFQDQIVNQTQQESLKPSSSSQLLRNKLYSQQIQARQMKSKVKNFFENIQNYEEAFSSENQIFYQNIDNCFTDIENQLFEFQNTLESGNAKIDSSIVDNLKKDIILYSQQSFRQFN